jgi:hypothetical protein
MIALETVREAYTTRWGKPTRTARYKADKHAVDVLIWDAQANREGVALYATVGASSWPLAGCPPEQRIEFFTGLKPARDDIADALAGLSLYSVLEGVALHHGHTVPSAGPLWPESPMSTFLVVRARPAFLPPLELPDGLGVEFLQAIPIFETERAYKMTHGVEALMSCWEKARTPFWNPDRDPNPVGLLPNPS